MINLHLNGDIVRCPDIRAIHKRAQEIRERRGHCKYGEVQMTCEQYINHCKLKSCAFSVCPLAGSKDCPQHKVRQETGSIEKQFRIDNVNYRKLSSAAHYLVKKSQHKTLFITLTFPKFKKQPDENILNNCFSNFMENIRKNYNCSGYVAVRERGTKGTRRYHYHVLCSIPFVPYADLNNAWCTAISYISHSSKNALTTDKKTVFITNPQRALRYVCKYFAKTKGQSSKSRIIFISNNLVRAPKRFNSEDTQYYRFEDLCQDYKSMTMTKTSDYTTAFRINDSLEFERFCNEILYKLYDLPVKDSDLYSFHTG
jgi:hypothetical protein